METKLISQFVVDLKYEDISTKTKEMVKLCLLDWFGCCIRGSIEQPATIMQKVLAQENSISTEATNICANPFLTTTLYAALSNGLYSHTLDMDDVHEASYCHLGTAVIPAVLAVAEKIGASGKEVITAIVAGYEVMARVAESVLPDSYFYWHATSIAGPFGSAAAAGKLLNLNTQQMIYCLGSAGTQSGGLFEFLKDGANSKPLHAGKAAFNGVLSAYLSQNGFTAAESILEGEKGFCRAMSKNPKLNKLVEGLGETFIIDNNSFKPYPCCRWAHSSINAALELKTRYNMDISQIVGITIKAFETAINITDNRNPKTIYGHKFSVQYCVAAALCYGRVGMDEFKIENMQNSQVIQLMNLCKMVSTTIKDVDGKVLIEQGEVILKMIDGRELSIFIPYPKGDPKNPMTFDEMEEKFRMLVDKVYNEDKKKGILQLVRTLEKTENFSTALSFLV